MSEQLSHCAICGPRPIKEFIKNKYGRPRDLCIKCWDKNVGGTHEEILRELAHKLLARLDAKQKSIEQKDKAIRDFLVFAAGYEIEWSQNKELRELITNMKTALGLIDQ